MKQIFFALALSLILLTIILLLLKKRSYKSISFDYRYSFERLSLIKSKLNKNKKIINKILGGT